jgi:hypothetical protein
MKNILMERIAGAYTHDIAAQQGQAGQSRLSAR